MISIKRGATFEAVLEFDDFEWANLWPAEEITAALRQEPDRYPLEIAVDEAARRIIVTAETATWGLGTAVWDLRVRRGGETLYFPADTNFALRVIEGVTP